MSNKRHEGTVSDYNSDYLDCREGHEWHWKTDWGILRKPGGTIMEFTRMKQCARCKTEAHRTFDGRTGRIIKTRYVYVDGYLSKKGAPIDSGDARLEMLRRSGIRFQRHL